MEVAAATDMEDATPWRALKDACRAVILLIVQRDT
jgi:hypothetical protein